MRILHFTARKYRSTHNLHMYSIYTCTCTCDKHVPNVQQTCTLYIQCTGVYQNIAGNFRMAQIFVCFAKREDSTQLTYILCASTVATPSHEITSKVLFQHFYKVLTFNNSRCTAYMYMYLPEASKLLLALSVILVACSLTFMWGGLISLP